MTTSEASPPSATTHKEYKTVRIERENGIGWVILNRPEKRNAMNPTMHFEMVEVLDELEFDSEVDVLVLTGAGESFCAGQDLREYFRAMDSDPVGRRRSQLASNEWRWRRLYTYPKVVITMVNGYCFGGAFTPVIASDISFAAEDATFGLSEVNWGILPGGLVSRVVADAMSYRDAMYYILTGEPFDGKQAAEMRLVTKAFPRDQLRAETEKLAQSLRKKNPRVLRAAKEAYKNCVDMSYAVAEDYLNAKAGLVTATDPENGRNKGITQFLDEKSYRPGLGEYDRNR